MSGRDVAYLITMGVLVGVNLGFAVLLIVEVAK